MFWRRNRFWLAIAILTGVFLGAPNAFGQDVNPRVTVFGGGSFVDGDRNFIVGGDPFRSEFVDGGKIGFRFTGDLSNHVAVEGAYSFGRNNLRIIELDEVPPQERGFGVRLHQFSGNVVIFFTSQDRRVRPFGTAGIGLARFSPTDAAKTRALIDEFIDEPAVLGSSTKFAFNFGAGLEARVTDHVGVRFDFRDHITKIPRFGVPTTPSGPGSDFFPVTGSIHNFEVSVGIVIFFVKP